MTGPVGSNNVLHSAVVVGAQLDQLAWPHCFIGGVAFLRWGEPRQTIDVDAVLLAGFGNEELIAKSLTDLFESRVENPIEFAVQNRILLLRDSCGIGIDLSLGALPFEERMMERSSLWDIPEHGQINTCSNNDLVVLKSVAARPQDWIDIKNVLIRQGDCLDRQLILEELTPLVKLKEEPEILDQLNQLFEKY